MKAVTIPCVNHDELRPVGEGRKQTDGDGIEFTEDRIACVDRRRLLRTLKTLHATRAAILTGVGLNLGQDLESHGKVKFYRQPRRPEKGFPLPLVTHGSLFTIVIGIALPHHVMSRGKDSEPKRLIDMRWFAQCTLFPPHSLSFPGRRC